MTEFNLKGGVDEQSGKWRAEILLTTPDGRQTKIETGYVFSSEEEATKILEGNLDSILTEFRKDGVEVVSRNGVNYS